MNDNLVIKAPARFAKTRLCEAEYQAFVRVLQGLGTTRSRMLRKMIRELIRQGPDLLPNELQPFREAVYQVGAIGRNLNQAVRAWHSGQMGDVPLDAELLERVQKQVAGLERELLAIVARSRRRWVNHEL